MAAPPDVLELLPWTHPFRMVDRMIEWVPHQRVVTLKRVSAGDVVVAGSGASVGSGGGVGAESGRYFPSALVLEGLSQSAALLFRLSYGAEALAGVPLLGHLKATIGGGAEPGDTVEFIVTAIKMTSRGGIFAGAARVNGVAIVEAELGFGVAQR